MLSARSWGCSRSRVHVSHSGLALGPHYVYWRHQLWDTGARACRKIWQFLRAWYIIFSQTPMMGSGMLLTVLMEITDAWHWNDRAILWVIKYASLSYLFLYIRSSDVCLLWTCLSRPPPWVKIPVTPLTMSTLYGVANSKYKPTLIVRAAASTRVVNYSNKLRFRNDLYCVGWGVKLYSLTHSNKFLLCNWYL